MPNNTVIQRLDTVVLGDGRTEKENNTTAVITKKASTTNALNRSTPTQAFASNNSIKSLASSGSNKNVKQRSEEKEVQSNTTEGNNKKAQEKSGPGKAPKKRCCGFPRGLPLHIMFILIMSLLGVACVVIWAAMYFPQMAAVNDLAEQMRYMQLNLVEREISNLIETPAKYLRTSTAPFENRMLNSTDYNQLISYIWDIYHDNNPTLSTALYFGLAPYGNMTGFLRDFNNPDKLYELMTYWDTNRHLNYTTTELVLSPVLNFTRRYEMGVTTNRSDNAHNLHYQYNPLGQWYITAQTAAANNATLQWTPVYIDNGFPNTLFVTLTRPMVDDNGVFWGYAGIDLTTTHIKNMLVNLTSAQTWHAAIIEASNGLVIEDSDINNVATIMGADGNLTRFKMDESTTPLLRDTARFLRSKFGSNHTAMFASGSRSFSTDYDHPKYGHVFVDCRRWSSSDFNAGDGLDWIIITAVPRSNYISSIIRSSVISAAVIIPISIALAFLGALITILTVSLPLRKISNEMQRVAMFDLDIDTTQKAPRIHEIFLIHESFLGMVAMLARFKPFLPSSILNEYAQTSESDNERYNAAAESESDDDLSYDHFPHAPSQKNLGMVDSSNLRGQLTKTTSYGSDASVEDNDVVENQPGSANQSSSVTPFESHDSQLHHHTILHMNSLSPNSVVVAAETSPRASRSSSRNSMRSNGSVRSNSNRRSNMKHADRFALGLVHQYVTVMVIRIDNFLRLSASITPEQLVRFHGKFLDQVSKVIVRYKGNFDKFREDVLLVYWNSRHPVNNSSLNACKAAMEVMHTVRGVQEALRREMQQQQLLQQPQQPDSPSQQSQQQQQQQQQEQEKQLPTFEVNIGIAADVALYGNMGNSSTRSLSVVGPVMHCALAVEMLNGKISSNQKNASSSRILIDHATSAGHGLRDRFILRPVDHMVVELEPKAQGESSISLKDFIVYELIAEKETMFDEWMYELEYANKLKFWAEFELAFKLLEHGDYDAAIKGFTKFLIDSGMPNDKPALRLLEVATQLKAKSSSSPMGGSIENEIEYPSVWRCFMDDTPSTDPYTYFQQWQLLQQQQQQQQHTSDAGLSSSGSITARSGQTKGGNNSSINLMHLL